MVRPILGTQGTSPFPRMRLFSPLLILGVSHWCSSIFAYIRHWDASCCLGLFGKPRSWNQGFGRLRQWATLHS